LLLLSLLGVPIGSVVVLSSYAVFAGLSVVDGDVLLQLLSLLVVVLAVLTVVHVCQYRIIDEVYIVPGCNRIG
jgi:hypothetical protein